MGINGHVPNPTRLPTPVQPDKLASLPIGYTIMQSIIYTDYLFFRFLGRLQRWLQWGAYGSVLTKFVKRDTVATLI